MPETFEIVGKALADPNRARILKLLEAGELCVCRITAGRKVYAMIEEKIRRLIELGAGRAGEVRCRRNTR